MSLKEMTNWLKSQARNRINYCADDAAFAEVFKKEVSVGIVKQPVDCQPYEKTRWNGKWDKDGLPKGTGVLEKMSKSESSDTKRIG